jgi:hypothetical protein
MFTGQTSYGRDCGAVQTLLALVVLTSAGLWQRDNVRAPRPLFVNQVGDLFQGEAGLKADAHSSDRPSSFTWRLLPACRPLLLNGSGLGAFDGNKGTHCD